MTLTETIKKMSPKSAFTYFDGKLKYEIGPVELKRRMDEGERGFDVIDVRSRDAYTPGTGSQHTRRRHESSCSTWETCWP